MGVYPSIGIGSTIQADQSATKNMDFSIQDCAIQRDQSGNPLDRTAPSTTCGDGAPFFVESHDRDDYIWPHAHIPVMGDGPRSLLKTYGRNVHIWSPAHFPFLGWVTVDH